MLNTWSKFFLYPPKNQVAFFAYELFKQHVLLFSSYGGGSKTSGRPTSKQLPELSWMQPGNVVHLRGNLKDRAWETTVVVVIHIEDIGSPAPVGAAVVGCKTQATVARDVVGLVEKCHSRDKNLSTKDVELGVEVVVHEVQAVFGRLLAQVRRSLDAARELAVQRIKGGFPHLGELIEKPRVLLLV
ncbi:hypothetical protein HG530_013467 [Fusarium avenaceum]|nr:hypothetical protein HG530_013467 [Fusarium avenaceum]